VNISISMHLWFQKVSGRWVPKMLVQIWITLIFLTFTKFPNLRDNEGMQKNVLWVQLVKKLGILQCLIPKTTMSPDLKGENFTTCENLPEGNPLLKCWIEMFYFEEEIHADRVLNQNRQRKVWSRLLLEWTVLAYGLYIIYCAGWNNTNSSVSYLGGTIFEFQHGFSYLNETFSWFSSALHG
jgi:hypothetical protein